MTALAPILEPVTLGHIRGRGCRDLLVYCASGWCHHHARLNADWLPDDTVLLELDRRMVCTACGLIGADIRPDWTPMTGAAEWGRAQSVVTGHRGVDARTRSMPSFALSSFVSISSAA